MKRCGAARLYDGLAIAGVAALTLHRWSQLGPYPPGLDGAQWLALGRGLRDMGRSSQGAYAPLLPLLAALANTAIGPLPALVLLATFSTLAISLAVWLTARAMLGSVWGLIAAALVVPSSALAEPVFYGGYPQTLACATGVLVLAASCLYLTSDSSTLLWLAALAALLAAAAHHLYFPVMFSSLVVAALAWLSMPENRTFWPRLKPLGLSLLPALVLSGIVAYQFARAGYAAPLSATVRSPAATWQYATRESPLIWLLFLLLAVGTMAVTWRRRGEPAWLFSSALMLPWGALILATGQTRLAPPLLVGIAIAVAFGGRAITSQGVPVSGLTLCGLIVALALAVLAGRSAIAFAEYYRVVDEPLRRAAATIAADSTSGAVAVRQDHRGWPIGWWFEALQTQPVYTGSDPRWLGFPDEQLRARQTASLFDGALDAATFAARANALGVRYLVIPKWDWIGWDRWLRDSTFPVTVLSDDDHYLVLRVIG